MGSASETLSRSRLDPREGGSGGALNGGDVDADTGFVIHRVVFVGTALALGTALGAPAPHATAARHAGAAEAALLRLHAPPGFTRTSGKCFLNIPGEANVCFVRRASVILRGRRWPGGCGASPSSRSRD